MWLVTTSLLAYRTAICDDSFHCAVFLLCPDLNSRRQLLRDGDTWQLNEVQSRNQRGCLSRNWSRDQERNLGCVTWLWLHLRHLRRVIPSPCWGHVTASVLCCRSGVGFKGSTDLRLHGSKSALNQDATSTVACLFCQPRGRKNETDGKEKRQVLPVWEVQRWL